MNAINTLTGRPWCAKCMCFGCPGGLKHYSFHLSCVVDKYNRALKAWYKALGKPRPYLLENIEVDGIDTRDYPDFCDAYISYAEYKGRPLTDAELDWLNDTYSDFVYDCVIKKVF